MEDIAVICYFDVDVHAVVAFVRIKVEVTGDDAVLTDRFFPKISRGIFGVSVQGHIIQRVRDRHAIHVHLNRDGGAVVLGLRVGLLVRQRHGDGVGFRLQVRRRQFTDRLDIVGLAADANLVANFRNLCGKLLIDVQIQPLVVSQRGNLPIIVPILYIQRRGADRGLRLREGDRVEAAIIDIVQCRIIVQRNLIDTGLLRALFQRDIVGQGHRAVQAIGICPADDVLVIVQRGRGPAFFLNFHISVQLDLAAQRIIDQSHDVFTDGLQADIQLLWIFRRKFVFSILSSQIRKIIATEGKANCVNFTPLLPLKRISLIGRILISVCLAVRDNNHDFVSSSDAIIKNSQCFINTGRQRSSPQGCGVILQLFEGIISRGSIIPLSFSILLLLINHKFACDVAPKTFYHGVQRFHHIIPPASFFASFHK